MTSLDTTNRRTVPATLADLVGDPAEFRADTWSTRPAVYGDAVANFLTQSDVWAMIDRGLVVYPYFRLAKDAVPAPLAEVSVTRYVQQKPLPAYADPVAVRAKYADGHTLILDEAGHWHAGLRTLLDSLRDDLRAEVHGAVVLGPPDATVVAEDRVATHLFVVQLAGQTRWQVGEISVTPQPGDVLYVPAGTRRHAVAVGGDSLHLAVSVTPPSAADLAELALAAFVKGERAERIAGSHHFLTPEQKVAWLRAELAQHLAELDRDALLDRAVRLRQGSGRL